MSSMKSTAATVGKLLFVASLLGAMSLAQVGRFPGSNYPNGTYPQGRNGQRRNQQEPCWQSAGVSKSAIEQHRQIQEQTRSRIQAVCSNSSLSPQQKQQEIQQIHEQTKLEMERLITPQQQQALRSCQQSHNRGGGGAGNRGGFGHGGGSGPCGEFPDGRGGPTGPPVSAPPHN